VADAARQPVFAVDIRFERDAGVKSVEDHGERGEEKQP
jgi:hypothetical protein